MYGYDIFHDKIAENLIGAARSGNTANTYIFEGERGLGKLETAKLFAAALTCENTSIAPCGGCQSCIQAGMGTNPDIIYFEKPADKQTIGVDPIRELNESAVIRPFAAQKKVYIIPDGDILTPQAQNAFLKTLEEPPEYVVFIIITTNRSFMLDTVLSRSVLIHFPPVPKKTEKYIAEKYPNAENKDFLVKYCEGIPGRIDEVMKDDTFYSLRDGAFENLPKLMTKNKLMAFSVRKYIEDNKDDAEKIIDFWIAFLRDILVIQVGSRDKIINSDKSENLIKLSKKLNPKVTTKAMEQLFKAKEMLRRSVSIKSVSLYMPLTIN